MGLPCLQLGVEEGARLKAKDPGFHSHLYTADSLIKEQPNYFVCVGFLFIKSQHEGSSGSSSNSKFFPIICAVLV